MSHCPLGLLKARSWLTVSQVSLRKVAVTRKQSAPQLVSTAKTIGLASELGLSRLRDFHCAEVAGTR
ncbi:MAG: hypothetical protein HYY91_03915 [Candidatus Omnitrophica bacterium]|nr:hypothetical protein [Candidatus Omnitrophota bacterium]